MTSIRPNVSGREQNIQKKHAVCATKRASKSKSPLCNPYYTIEAFSKFVCAVLHNPPKACQAVPKGLSKHQGTLSPVPATSVHM